MSSAVIRAPSCVYSSIQTLPSEKDFPLKHAIEYLIFQVLGFIIRLVPFRFVSRIGSGIGEWTYTKLRYRRSVVTKNLWNAFPELPEVERERIAVESFRSVGAAFFEMLWTPKLTSAMMRSLGMIENVEVLQRLKEQGKGIVVVTAHLGAWEFVSQLYTVHTGETIHVIYKQQSNRRIDTVVKRWRERFGNKAVSMEQAPREIFRALSAGGLVGIVGDQSAPQEATRVRFFGREVPTFEGPAIFSLRTGAPLCVAFIVRRSDGTHAIVIEEIRTSDLQGASNENVRILTQRHVEATESIIRKYPGQWMWMHKRWKHVPDRA